MRALLLAAGFGSRLRPLTNYLPKCLVPINGSPLLDYWLAALSQAGVSGALVNTHYLSEMVDAHLAAAQVSFRLQTVYEPNLLGTAGTLAANSTFFDGDSVLLCHADNLTIADLGSFEQKFRARPKACHMTMMTFRTDNPQSCGIVELNDEGIVTDFHEKVANPPGDLANAAVFLMDEVVVNYVAEKKGAIVDFSKEVVPQFLGAINTYHNEAYHRDIGNTSSLLAAQLEYPGPVVGNSNIALDEATIDKALQELALDLTQTEAKLSSLDDALHASEGQHVVICESIEHEMLEALSQKKAHIKQVLARKASKQLTAREIWTKFGLRVFCMTS